MKKPAWVGSQRSAHPLCIKVSFEPFAKVGFSDISCHLFTFITTVVEKAAALCFSLVMNQPFLDGNKRVGHFAMETFLVLNGYEINAHVDEQEAIIMGVAAGELILALIRTTGGLIHAPIPKSSSPSARPTTFQQRMVLRQRQRHGVWSGVHRGGRR